MGAFHEESAEDEVEEEDDGEYNHNHKLCNGIDLNDAVEQCFKQNKIIQVVPVFWLMWFSVIINIRFDM